MFKRDFSVVEGLKVRQKVGKGLERFVVLLTSVRSRLSACEVPGRLLRTSSWVGSADLESSRGPNY